MITWEFLSEKASRRSKMLNAIFEMKFSFMWLHLFPWESKQSRCLIEWACLWHTPNSKIFISFWHSLKSQSGTKGTLFLLLLFGYTYSSPLFAVLLQLLICDYGDRDATSSSTHWCWPHTGRPDTDISPQLGPINSSEINVLLLLWAWAREFFMLSSVFVSEREHLARMRPQMCVRGGIIIWRASSSHHEGNGDIWIIDWNNVK